MQNISKQQSLAVSGGIGYYPGMNEGATVIGDFFAGWVVGACSLWDGLLEDARK